MTIISDALRRGLRSSSKPLIEIERFTGISADSLTRFLRGEQSLRLDVADKLAEFLGVQVMLPSPALAEETTNVLHLIANTLNALHPELGCPMTKGHFFTVPKEIEDSVKLEVLRRAQPGGTAVLIGLAFNSGDPERNRRQADRYRSFLDSQSPPFKLDELPPPKSNVYITTCVPVPGHTDLKNFARQCAGIVSWFLDRPYEMLD